MLRGAACCCNESKRFKSMQQIEINIEGAAKHVFLKNADVMNVLNRNNIHAGETLSDIELMKNRSNN